MSKLRGTFVVNISKVLASHNMTVHDLAERIDMPAWYLSRICKGEVNPSIYEVLLISNALSTPVECLYWLEG